ncbi:MAG: hypothetical protein WKH97_12670 [Casimicrobiaceae bacterium]
MNTKFRVSWFGRRLVLIPYMKLSKPRFTGIDCTTGRKSNPFSAAAMSGTSSGGVYFG